mmetsp:Transcript_35096/g.88678  ORF Transcript_35096/g.88678 Transcript_35096/m.88678 type:complete len:684 (+) Transcript_35096:58-2109(+)
MEHYPFIHGSEPPCSLACATSKSLSHYMGADFLSSDHDMDNTPGPARPFSLSSSSNSHGDSNSHLDSTSEVFSAGASAIPPPGASSNTSIFSPASLPSDDSSLTTAPGSRTPSASPNLPPRAQPQPSTSLPNHNKAAGAQSNGGAESESADAGGKGHLLADDGGRGAMGDMECDDHQEQQALPNPSSAVPKASGISLRSGRKVASGAGLELQSKAAAGTQQPPLVVKVIYTTNEQALCKINGKGRGLQGAPKDGFVMSDTRREWMRNINRPLTEKEAVKGQVTSLGSVCDTEGQQIRNVMVCVPQASQVPKAKPLLRVDVRKLRTLGQEVSSNDAPPTAQTETVGPPLARPCFSPFETGLVALGTEQHPNVDSEGALLSLVQVNRGAKTHLKVMSHPLRLGEAISGMDWLSAKEILVATGKHMTIVSLSEGRLRKRIDMPVMHRDDIRDIQLSKHNKNMCLSGGYDGRAFITDCERVVSDQMSYRPESSNAVYETGPSSVSSVQWNPVMANLASITTDSGYMHCFDTRLGSTERQTVIIKTGFSQLYSHGWSDTHGFVLGYGDGSLRLFDIRRPSHCVCTFSDPHVSMCGDIVFDPQRRFMVNFGFPGFSVWNNDTHCLSLWNSDPCSVSTAQLSCDLDYKQSGAFLLTGGRQHSVFGTTDAHGFFSLYDVHSSGKAAIDIRS